MLNVHEYIHAYPTNETLELSGGYVKRHPNQSKLEWMNNLRAAIFLAKRGYKVWLLPISTEPGMRSADAWLENEDIFVEFKLCQTPSASAIDKAIQKGKKQAKHILIQIDCEMTPEKIIDGVENRCLRPENKAIIASIWLIWNEQLFLFSIEDIISKQWRDSLEIK
jgi:hypothetical protein